MARKNLPAVRCGELAVDFFARQNADEVATVDIKTPRGFLRVSAREPTALDLVGYVDHAGGLDNVATVLTELGPEFDPDTLVEAAAISPPPWAQRLGWLLDQVEADVDTGPLASWIHELAPRATPLDPASPDKGAPRDRRWKVAINTDVEPGMGPRIGPDQRAAARMWTWQQIPGRYRGSRR